MEMYIFEVVSTLCIVIHNILFRSLKNDSKKESIKNKFNLKQAFNKPSLKAFI